jgi:hypothetical protein
VEKWVPIRSDHGVLSGERGWGKLEGFELEAEGNPDGEEGSIGLG